MQTIMAFMNSGSLSTSSDVVVNVSGSRAEGSLRSYRYCRTSTASQRPLGLNREGLWLIAARRTFLSAPRRISNEKHITWTITGPRLQHGSRSYEPLAPGPANCVTCPSSCVKVHHTLINKAACQPPLTRSRKYIKSDALQG